MTKATLRIISAALLLGFSLFILFLVIFLDFDLENLDKIFSIFGSISIGVAILTYFYQKRRDELLASIDQISFFRKEIIAEDKVVTVNIFNKKPDFVVSFIDLNNPKLDFIKKEFSVNFERQLSVFFDANKEHNLMIDVNILDSQIMLLNLLEEFSLRVIHLNTFNDPILDTVKKSFVEILEKNAVALLFMRDIKVGKHLYNSNLKLYSYWKTKDEGRSNVIKNLRKFELITSEKRDELYKIRRTYKNI